MNKALSLLSQSSRTGICKHVIDSTKALQLNKISFQENIKKDWTQNMLSREHV